MMSKIAFDHRVDVAVTDSAVADTPHAHVVGTLKTDKGRVIDVHRLPESYATFELIDRQTGRRARVDLEPALYRAAGEFLDLLNTPNEEAA